MNLEIIICDDNEKAVLILSKWVNTIIEEKGYSNVNVSFKTTQPNNIVRSLDTFRNKTDSFYTFLLDIDLKCEINGIALAEMIRNALPERNKIIFITAHSHLSLEVLNKHIEPFAYLTKPLREEYFKLHFTSLYETFKKLQLNNNKSQEKVIVLEAHGRSHYVYIKDILYIETAPNKDKYVIVHTIKGESIYHYATLSKIYEELNSREKNFQKCYKSHVINIQHVKGIDSSRQVVIVHNTELPISRDKKVQGAIRDSIKFKLDIVC